MILKNGMIYQDCEFEKKDVEILNGKITNIGNDLPEKGEDTADIEGFRVVPGFFEIHIHGSAMIDVNAADAEGFEKMSRFLAKQGVTDWLCSILTDTKEHTLECIEQYRRWKELEPKGAYLCGIHLEGPFLNPKFKGAMPESLLRGMDLDLLSLYQDAAGGDIRYITVAPELPGVTEAIPDINDMGITVALGHSDATYDEAMRAIDAGAKACTHTFNAMRLFHQHEPGIMGAALESDIYCEAICDGAHLHPGAVRLLLKTKGSRRVIAITDAIMAAGIGDGEFKLGINDVIVKGSDATLKSDGTRAGSVLTSSKAFENLMSFTGKDAEEILPLFTENPAALLGMEDRIGSVKENADADLLFIDGSGKLKGVCVKGRRVV